MLNLFGQGNAQAMIVDNHGLQLFYWKNKQLTFQGTFLDSAESLSKFSQALVSSPATPLIIISNFMEESFLNETIAHVTGNDRSSLLERKLGYAFRSSPYRAAKIIERESEGRRDDKILLSALSKPELLKPWIKEILNKKIPIQSITSLAYLTESFIQGASPRSTKSENLLIVSLERGSNLRQTFLKKGKILFSRLTTLQSADTASLANNIQNESLQIRNYLERIKAIRYDDPLVIQIYSSVSKASFSEDLLSTNLNSFELFNTTEQAAKHSINLNGSDINVSTFFLSCALRRKKIPNIYAPFNVRRYFQLNNISQALRWSAALLILVLTALKIPTFLDTMDNRDQEQNFISQTIPLTAEYDVLSRRFPETPIPSVEMALIVESYEKIKQQSYLPTETLELISQAFSISPGLELKSIDWELSENTNAIVPRSSRSRSRNAPQIDQSNSFQQAILEERSILKVLINGLVFSPDSYREAQNRVLTFISALENINQIVVNPISLPTEVRTDASISAMVDGQPLQADFTLELIIGESE